MFMHLPHAEQLVVPVPQRARSFRRMSVGRRYLEFGAWLLVRGADIFLGGQQRSTTCTQGSQPLRSCAVSASLAFLKNLLQPFLR